MDTRSKNDKNLQYDSNETHKEKKHKMMKKVNIFFWVSFSLGILVLYGMSASGAS